MGGKATGRSGGRTTRWSTALQPDPTAVFGRRVGAVVIDGALVVRAGSSAVTPRVAPIEYVELDGAADVDDVLRRLHRRTTTDGVCFTVDDTGLLQRRRRRVGRWWGSLMGLAVLMYVVLQGLTGWTVGKLLTGIRTVQRGRQPARDRQGPRALAPVDRRRPALPRPGRRSSPASPPSATAASATWWRRPSWCGPRRRAPPWRSSSGRSSPPPTPGRRRAWPACNACGMPPSAGQARAPVGRGAQHLHPVGPGGRRAWMQWDDTGQGVEARSPLRAGPPHRRRLRRRPTSSGTAPLACVTRGAGPRSSGGGARGGAPRPRVARWSTSVVAEDMSTLRAEPRRPPRMSLRSSSASGDRLGPRRSAGSGCRPTRGRS